MISGLYTALTGMNVATLRAEVAARNIVNSLSAGSDPNAAPLASETLAGSRAYQPQRVLAYSIPGGGVGGRTEPITPSTYPAYDPTNPAADENGVVQYPNVSLESEFAQLTLAVTSYKASAEVLKTIDETMGALLDRKS
jgi:flagellar basal-body rod protein FlgC